MTSPFPAVPPRLYKYVTFDRLDVLKNECIRFTQPAALNDPWELKPYLEKLVTNEFIEKDIFDPIFNNPKEDLMVDHLVQEWKKLPPAQRANVPGGLPALKKRARRQFRDNPELVAQAFAEARAETTEIMKIVNPEGGRIFVKTLCESFGILSLTEKRDNKLMWSHYSTDHTGMVIEFDTSHKFFTHRLTPNDDLSGPKPVVYAAQLPAFQSIQDLVELVDKAGAKTWEPLMFTKSEDWLYEKEWRMIRHLKNADKTITTGRDGKPLDNPIHLFKLPASCITGLILGALMPEDKRQEVIDFIRTDGRYGHVALSQAKISNRTFNLEIEPLPTNPL